MRASFEREGGKVLRPGDAEYSSYTVAWNKFCKATPTLVVLPRTSSHASQALSFVKKYGQRFTIMSGGHDYECNSMTHDVLFNLALMNQIEVDYEAEVATLGAGARWGDVYSVLEKEGYDIPGDQCPMVGVGGNILGTGFNWLLSRFYGSAAENTLEVTAVLADGSIRTISWESP